MSFTAEEKRLLDQIAGSRVGSDLLETKIGEGGGTSTHATRTDNPHSVTKAQIGLSNVDNVQQIPASEKGAINGVATLDATGKVPSTQLPSYVDDVLEYADLASFPVTGESGKIYVAIDTSKSYRWSGSMYVEISSSEVTSVFGRTGAITAQAGDYSKSDVGLSNVQNILHKFDGTAAPTVNDDTTLGYSVGSDWNDIVNNKAYRCTDNTTGAAVWVDLTGSGGGSGDVVGPASSVDNAIVRFDGITGKLVQDYTSDAPTISDTGVASFGMAAYGNSQRIGTASNCSGTDSTAYGTLATANTRSTAIGKGANGNSFTDVTTVGMNSAGAGARATVVGVAASANTDSCAYGYAANASGVDSFALGRSSVSSAAQTVAIGKGAQATTSSGATVVGANSTSSGADALAFGRSVTSSGIYSQVYGYNSTSSHNNTVVFGNSYSSWAANQVIFGSVYDMWLGRGQVNATASLYPARFWTTGGLGTDIAGANMEWNAGIGTGAGLGGSFKWNVAPAGASGSTANAQALAFSIDSTKKGTFESNVQVKGDLKVDKQLSNSINGTVLIPSGTTQTVDWNNGQIQKIDLVSATGNVTMTLSNPQEGATYVIKVTQGATPRNIVWPASVKWPGGTAPIISTTNDAVDIITFIYLDSEFLGSFKQDMQ